MHEMIRLDQIGPRLERLRLSPTAFAKKLGIYHTTLTKLIGGDTSVSFETVTRVWTLLNQLEVEQRDYLLGLHPLPAPAVDHGAEAAE